MLAVCFTRCDAISAIVGLLNDTSVVSAHACILHTLLDVIPLDCNTPRYRCPRMFLHSYFRSHRLLAFGLDRHRGGRAHYNIFIVQS
jgi:hypothetical protein